jgi:amidase
LTGVDPRDDATEASRDKARTDYTSFLDANGLRGAKIGVGRRFFRSGSITAKLLEGALEQLKSQGATLVDFNDDIGRGNAGDWEVLQYEFKDGINAYLAGLGPKSPMRNLEDLIRFNEENKDSEMPFFGQETFLKAQAKGPLTDQAYLDAVARCRRLSRDEGIDAVMDKYQLDAIVGPSGGPAGPTDHIYGDRESGGGSSGPAAVAGYPNITVPAGQHMGMPVGLSFFGRAYSEPVLLKLAFAFEQGSKARRAPRFFPTIG